MDLNHWMLSLEGMRLDCHMLARLSLLQDRMPGPHGLLSHLAH